MRAVPAIYDDGRVSFSFHYPNYEGPVAIIVIFPDERDYDLEYQDPPDLEPPDSEAVEEDIPGSEVLDERELRRLACCSG